MKTDRLFVPTSTIWILILPVIILQLRLSPRESLFNMEDIVNRVLEEEQQNAINTTVVSKQLQLDFDVGNLLATDSNELDSKLFRDNKEEYLKALARDNTQLLINEIWKLPIERYQDVIMAKLPKPKTILPREKPIPKERPPTKWEEFAKTKGIQNRRKSKLVWDETEKKWKPRWGYNRVNDEKKDWVLEVPENADPFEDQFAKRNKEKDERIAKNELQRLRNIAKARKIPLARVGIAPKEDKPKEELNKARNLARIATASVGKFTEKLPKEKINRKQGKKRQFDALMGDMKKEKSRELGIIERISNKKAKVDTEKLTQAIPLKPTSKKQKENVKSKPEKKGTRKQQQSRKRQTSRNKGRKKK